MSTQNFILHVVYLFSFFFFFSITGGRWLEIRSYGDRQSISLGIYNPLCVWDCRALYPATNSRYITWSGAFYPLLFLLHFQSGTIPKFPSTYITPVLSPFSAPSPSGEERSKETFVQAPTQSRMRKGLEMGNDHVVLLRQKGWDFWSFCLSFSVRSARVIAPRTTEAEWSFWVSPLALVQGGVRTAQALLSVSPEE